MRPFARGLWLLDVALARDLAASHFYRQLVVAEVPSEARAPAVFALEGALSLDGSSESWIEIEFLAELDCRVLDGRPRSSGTLVTHYDYTEAREVGSKLFGRALVRLDPS